MKRIAVSVLVFLLILGIGVANSLYFDKVCERTIDSVNESIRLANEGDFASAAEASQKAEDYWEGRRTLLSYTVNHGFLYEVDTRLTGLSALSSEEAKEEFLATAEQAVQAITYVMSDK